MVKAIPFFFFFFLCMPNVVFFHKIFFFTVTNFFCVETEKRKIPNGLKEFTSFSLDHPCGYTWSLVTSPMMGMEIFFSIPYLELG